MSIWEPSREFGWDAGDYDLLASGSLAGHIIECGPQVTGGNFTDWEDTAHTIADIGYPIAEISEDGHFDVSKPNGTGGQVSVGTVAEQMLYEIGDPAAYYLPDVICDFTEVTLTSLGQDVVRVSPAKGRGAPGSYKACLTYNDGWKIVSLWMFVGDGARAKGQAYGEASLARARRKLRAKNLPDYTEASAAFFGDDSHYGDFAKRLQSREVVMKLAAKHEDKQACALLFKEATGLALATPAGLAPLSTARFAHFNKGRAERFYLPGTASMNIVLHETLGGGGMASLRFDPQGKSYGQILLQTPISIPAKHLEL